MEIQRSQELEAVVRRIWKAFGEGSLAALSNMTSQDPSLRLILSSDDEWFSGHDQITKLLAERSTHIDIDRIEFNRIEAFECGDVGWTAADLTTIRKDGQSASFRQTMVFGVEDGVWRVLQTHTSRGVPAEETFGYEIAENLSALLSSLTEEHSDDIARAAGTSGVVTFMFTDIQDSTMLSTERGEEQWVRTIQEHFDEVDRAVTAGDGTVVKTLGDGAMAVFPTARGAANAAIAIQRSDSDHGMKVRIGIHTGEAMAVGSDYAGIAVAKAARVASAAAGGETLVSSATRELLTRFDYPFGDERTAELKGLPGTHRLIPLLTQAEN